MRVAPLVGLFVKDLKITMTTLLWILGSTFAMSLVAWIGLITLAFNESTLRKFLLPLVAFAAGSLMGGSFLHLIPETVLRTGPRMDMFLWLLFGFSLFLLMEQCLLWYHHHVVPSDQKEPFTYLILLADGLHNFVGGMVIAGSFLISVPVGILTWFAAAAHEIPQELGDFGVLLKGGWEKTQALTLNFLSALMIVPGGMFAYFLSTRMDTTFLLPFSAGNFIYIAASNLIPEIKHSENLRNGIVQFLAFMLGIGLVLAVRGLVH